MPLPHEIAFWTARLTMVGDASVLTTPLYPEITWMNASSETLAFYFGLVTAQNWSKTGEHLPWLVAAPPLDLHSTQLEVTCSPAHDSGLPSTLTLMFDAVLGTAPSGHWIGFVPALGVGAASADEATVRAQLHAAIRLEFMRNQRLMKARRVLCTQWYTDMALTRTTAQGYFYTHAERKAFQQEEKTSKLHVCARRFNSLKKRIFEVDTALQRLRQAIDNPYHRNIVLIGPAGVGKTALVEAFARTCTTMAFWETNATRLERVLTDPNGWQDNLSRVIQTLKEQSDWLFVRNLQELFEVGRFENNDVSMGEYIRPRLAAGEIRFISEATPEQIAHLEARYPGCLDSFQRIELKEPARPALISLCSQRCEHITPGIQVDADAINTLIRLQKRFSPYSGFPGKPIRFLESMLLSKSHSVLDRDAILSQFCEETGMPRALVDAQHHLPTADIERHFQQRIFGQPDAIRSIVEALVSVRAGLSQPKRPVSTMLFVGPTGVGKTETAKALATFMFGSPDRMLRLDMSEYATAAAAIRLTEGPAGEGRLTAAIRREPFTVVLLDEIEKAHPMVFDLLLQVLGEGRLSDGRGRTADFCSSIIIMTSNIGAAEASIAPSGFRLQADRATSLIETYRAAAERHFRPEFFNRIDRLVAFAPLSKPAIAQVLERELAALAVRPGMRMRRAHVEMSERVRAHLCTVGYNPTWGARQLQRTLREQVCTPIAHALNTCPDNTSITLTLDVVAQQVTCQATVHKSTRTDRSTLEAFTTLADRIDAYRHITQQIADGSRYAAMISQIQYLTRRKARLKDKFWKDGDAAAELGRLQVLASDCQALFETINTLSTDAILAEMDNDLDLPLFRSALQSYTESHNTTLRALYDAMAQEDCHATLGIYAPEPQSRALLDAYMSALKALRLSARSRTVWLRKTPEARGLSNTLPSNEAERQEAIQDRKQRFALLPVGHAPTPDCHQIVGFELEATGAGAAALLRPEQGIVQWDGTPPSLGKVFVMPDSWDTFDRREHRPQDLHRRPDANLKPRRWLRPSEVYDSRDGKFYGPLETALETLLTTRFKQNMKQDLVS